MLSINDKKQIKKVLSILAQNGIGFVSGCNKGMFEFSSTEDVLKYLDNTESYLADLVKE